MIGAAVAGELTERWRTHSSGWPQVDRDAVFVVQDDAVVALSSDGSEIWTLPPQPGQRWLSASPDPHGVVVRGAIDADASLHLLGVADRQTGSLYFTETPSVADGERALIGMAVEQSGFYRSSFRRNDRQYFAPATGQPISPLFEGDEIHEYPIDGGPHDIDWWPSVQAIGRVGPVTLLLHRDTVSGWTTPAAPVFEIPTGAVSQQLSAELFRLGDALVRFDAASGLPRWTVPLQSDECTAHWQAVRLEARGVVVVRCQALDVRDPETGALVETTAADGDSPLGSEEGLLKLGPDQGFGWSGPDGKRWVKRVEYGNVEQHGSLIAWYSRDGLSLLDTDGRTVWQSSSAIVIGLLDDQTLVVRLEDGTVLGLTTR